MEIIIRSNRTISDAFVLDTDLDTDLNVNTNALHSNLKASLSKSFLSLLQYMTEYVHESYGRQLLELIRWLDRHNFAVNPIFHEGNAAEKLYLMNAEVYHFDAEGKIFEGTLLDYIQLLIENNANRKLEEITE